VLPEEAISRQIKGSKPARIIAPTTASEVNGMMVAARKVARNRPRYPSSIQSIIDTPKIGASSNYNVLDQNEILAPTSPSPVSSLVTFPITVVCALLQYVRSVLIRIREDNLLFIG
jgi:hypothetical protein